MNSKLVFLAGTCGLLLLSPAQADAQTQTRKGFEIGAEVFDYSYRERFEGETVAKDDGTFGGATVSYTAGLGGNFVFRPKLSIDYGSVDYSSEDGEIKNVRQSIYQLELQVARDFQLGRTATITPFIGLGSRLLNDNSGGKETEDGFQGYDREVSYAYVPLGAAVTTQIAASNTLTLSAQYNWVVGGDAESKFSAIDPEFPDLKLEIPGGHGLEASAVVGIPVGRRQLRVGPFVRHWDIQRSDSQRFEEDGEVLELFEPKNRTTELGVRLSLSF
ncbi:MAG TPA: hypothetical protein VGR19_07360 [Allosphingosinicella sp.]|nr:hypothetical protein [Allosphingosinicella sp.]